MVLNATFNNISTISWWSDLLVEETGVPGENHRPVASHWQPLSHNFASSTPRHERGFELTTLVVIATDCTGSCKLNYHAIKKKQTMLIHWSIYLSHVYKIQILIIIQARTYCFCGNQADRSTFTTSKPCDRNCKGNGSQTCGGR